MVESPARLDPERPVEPATLEPAPPPTTRRPRKPIGVGDVLIGLAITIAISAVVSTAIVLTDSRIIDQLSAGELPGDIAIPAEGILLAFAAGWTGIIGWPVLVSRRKGTGSLAVDYGLTKPTGDDLRFGAALGAVALAANLASTFAVGLFSGGDTGGNTASLPLNETSGLLLVLLIAAITIGAPITEEVFFRGLALRAFTAKWGSGAGIACSSLAFALLHFGNVDNVWAAAETFAATLAAGVLFGWVATRRQSVTAGIVAHGIVNTAVVTLILAGVA